MQNKKKILFVGSFAKSLSDSRIGGQMIACNALVNSSLNKDIEWVKLDTTAVLPIQPVIIRSYKALLRLLRLLKHLTFSSIDTVLIFSSSGLSLYEKGGMAIISKTFRKEVIFAPRSGLILNDLKKEKKRKFIKRVFDASSFIICQGSNWKEVFTKEIINQEPQKYKIIPNWVDIDVYRPKKIKKTESSIRLLYLGWVVDYKGIYDLIEALKKISDQTPNLIVDICGNGDDFNKAKQIVESSSLAKKITFHGWVNLEQKINFLSKTDIYILPSHYEGFPNALLEAMSSGIASIATDVGAIASVLVNRKNGLLISPKDVEAIASSILELYKDDQLRHRLAKQARVEIESNFSKDHVMGKFRKILL